MEYKTGELSLLELQRYMSQIHLSEIGVDGQMRLKAASVSIVGAGALGCAALQYLAAAGIGKITIIDPDNVELGNLHRQILYHTADIGRLKCEIAKERIHALNPYCQIDTQPVFLNVNNAPNLIQGTDVVIDATDNFTSRYVINDACIAQAKPFIYGSIRRFEGQVAVFNALYPCGRRGPDYRSLFPFSEDCDYSTSCKNEGVIGALAGIVGSIQALEAIKLVLQIETTLSGKLFLIDALSWSQRLYSLR